MTAKKLVIHVGYHKTGSSSVQKWLLDHAGILAPHLKAYNLADSSSNPLKFAAINWMRGPGSRETLLQHCTEMAAEMRAVPQPVICITDESLLGMPLGFVNGNYVENDIYPQARRIVDTLAEAFAEFDLTIVAVEREADRWLRSVHNQMSKQGCLDEDYEGYLKRFEPVIDWPALRAEIEAGLAGRGRMVALSFEQEFDHAMVSNMGFFQLLDIPANLMASCRLNLEQVNPSAPLRRASARDQPIDVAVLGGSNSMIAEGWVNLLRRDYAKLVQASNLSVGACTTTMALYRFLSRKDQLPGATVVWEYGINEYNHMAGGQPLSSLLRHVEWLLQICVREKRPFVPLLMRNKSQAAQPEEDVYLRAIRDLFHRYGLQELDCNAIIRVMARGKVDLDAWYSDNAHYATTTDLPRRVAEAVLLALPDARVPVSPPDALARFEGRDLVLVLPSDPSARLENSIVNCSFAPFEDSPEMDVPGRILAAIIATSGSGPNIRLAAGDQPLGYYATQVVHGPKVPPRQLRQLVFDSGSGGLAVPGNRLRLSIDHSHGRPTVQTMYTRIPPPEEAQENGLVALLCEHLSKPS